MGKRRRKRRSGIDLLLDDVDLFDDGIPEAWEEAERRFLRDIDFDWLLDDDEEAPLTHGGVGGKG